MQESLLKTEAFLNKLGWFSPQDLSNSLWGLARLSSPAPRCRQVQPNELVIKPAAFQPKQPLTDADVERAM